MDSVPHITLPIEVRASAYRTVDQDTTAEVANCVAAIVAYPIGYREEAPDFGIADPTFGSLPLDTSAIERACEAYEPRAVLRIIEAQSLDPFAANVQIEVNVSTSEDT